MMALLRPRDWKLRLTGTWRGKGGQGEGKEEEEDPESPLHPEAAAVAVETVSDKMLEPVGASVVLGVVLGEEASPLPVPVRRHQPCERASRG